MIFSSPSFLWAFGLLAIPIIIHLFRFKRYKRLYFPDVSLLREIQTKSQTKNQLRHMLVLASRLLMLTALVLAFAMPKLTDSNSAPQGHTVVGIYVDNSLSMQNQGEEGKLLPTALQHAFDIIEAYPRTTKFQLMTNDLSSAERRFTDRDLFVAALDNVRYSPRFQPISRIVTHHANAKSEAGLENSVLYLISDFTANTDSGLVAQDSTTAVRLLSCRGLGTQNLSVDSVWTQVPLIQPGREYNLGLRASNRGNSAAVDVPVSLTVNGTVANTIVISIAPRSHVDTAMTFIAPGSGFVQGAVSIEDQPVEFDNAFLFTLPVKTAIPVVEVSGDEGARSPFAALFGTDQYLYKKESVGQIKQTEVAAADLLVLNSIVTWSSGLTALVDNHLANGKNAVVVLPEKLDARSQEILAADLGIAVTAWDTATLTANRIETNDPVYAGVFESQPKNLNYPMVHGHWKIADGNASGLVSLFDGSPLLAVIQRKNGRLFLITTEMDVPHTNFHRHALFVPAMLNISLAGGAGQRMAYAMGEDLIPVSPAPKEGSRMESMNDSAAFIPGITHEGILVNNMVSQAGFYKLIEPDGAITAIFAFNHDRRESALHTPDDETLLENLRKSGIHATLLNGSTDSIKKEIAQSDMGTELWPYFVLLALAFLLTETLLTKLFNR